jgi:hypothetical protein
MLDIVVHENVRLSEVIASEILDSDQLPIVFHLLDHLRTRNPSDLVDKITDWERFQSLAFELISPRIKINLGKDGDKAAGNFIGPITSAYSISTCKITLSDFHKQLPGLESLLKNKRRLRKLWQVTRDPASKMAVKWVVKTIR